MKTSHIIAAIAATFVFTGAAHAADAAKAKALMKGSDCSACHAADTKLVGPSFKEIAAKYKGDAGAIDKLVHKVKSGGSGVWGAVPMTPHPNMKDGDIKTIVEWIVHDH
ncbi:MAG: c-type cytochrome [Betaproteobacteria bacterium]|nr:c-type cytochrome [Betaproteobacteria bacterium]